MNSESKAEEITRTSLMMNLFSKINPDNFSLDNSPFIIGGEKLFTDSKTKDTVEQAFGQLNIPDLFKQFNFVLNSTYSEAIKLKEDLQITPNFYVLKAKYNHAIKQDQKLGDMYNLMTLITPYSDLNLTELYDLLEDVTLDFNGVLRRIDADLEREKINEQEKVTQTENLGGLLLERIFYKVFLQREISGGVEKPRKPPNLVAVLFQRGRLERFWQCKSCSFNFEHKEDMQDIICPKCESNDVELSPPYLNIQKASIAYPNDLLEFEKSDRSPYKPIDLYYLYQASSIPDSIRYLTYQIDPYIFKNILTIPAKSWFDYRDTDDNIQLYSLWRRENDEFTIITGISDSRLEGPDILPSMTLRIFIRDLKEAVKKNYSRKQMIKGSILSDWNLSNWIQLEQEATPEPLISWENLAKETI